MFPVCTVNREVTGTKGCQPLYHDIRATLQEQTAGNFLLWATPATVSANPGETAFRSGFLAANSH